MPKSTIDCFKLSREILALVMQNCGDEIFIGLEKVCAIAHGIKPFHYMKSTLASRSTLCNRLSQVLCQK